MASGTVFLDVDDEITSAAARIRGSEATKVALVVPYGSRIATSRMNFRLLSREAVVNNRRLSIVSTDPATRALAASAGLPVFASVAEWDAVAAGISGASASDGAAAGSPESLTGPASGGAGGCDSGHGDRGDGRSGHQAGRSHRFIAPKGREVRGPGAGHAAVDAGTRGGCRRPGRPAVAVVREIACAIASPVGPESHRRDEEPIAPVDRRPGRRRRCRRRVPPGRRRRSARSSSCPRPRSS